MIYPFNEGDIITTPSKTIQSWRVFGMMLVRNCTTKTQAGNFMELFKKL